MEYAEHEPFGSIGAFNRAGMLMAMYHNSHTKKGSRKVYPSDFFPFLKARIKVMTASEIEKVMDAHMAVINAEADRLDAERRNAR